jgi:glycosyltransferase involved in cell wall biosynthesis
MRICLLSTAYPPTNSEGIARQRQVLAAELARLGHDVHVVTCGPGRGTRVEHGVQVHEVSVIDTNTYSDAYPGLDAHLTYSQALYEGLLDLATEQPCDIVDVPLWSGQGLVTLQKYQGPIVLWLQTPRRTLTRFNLTSSAEADKWLGALEHYCLRQAGSWLADSCAVLNAITRDYAISGQRLSAVAHLGLPDDRPRVKRTPGPTVEALVVGRLEARKGTDLLLEILPALLRRYPHLSIRFVGRDNSAFDGWHKRHKQTYAEYFQMQYHDLSARAIFEDFVSEARLATVYAQADMLLAPSRFESFGLIYLEAMRASLPIVTWAIEAAAEIFPAGESQGALLTPPGDRQQFAKNIARLIDDPTLRLAVGEAGRERFESTFLAQHMAQATLSFYEQVCTASTQRKHDTRTVYQVMEALDVGDAVSSIAQRNARLLKNLGQPPEILARFSHPDVMVEMRPVRKVLAQPDCGLIFHFWNYNTSAWVLSVVRGRKALYYHNVTPPQYFPRDSQGYISSTRGYEQLKSIINQFDLLIGDSRYNLQELSPYLSQPKPGVVISPLVDAEEIQAEPFDPVVVETLRASQQVNILFTGRIARNKRQDWLMRTFDWYWRKINRHACLWLVGDENSETAYRAELEQLRQTLLSRDQIIFTGKVPDTQLRAYYRAADVFVCASEHEGFCVPIVEAMALNVPVIAYAAAAVPETMGEAGILIRQWDAPRVAELMQLVISDGRLRRQIIDGQSKNFQRFSINQARERLTAAVNYLLHGEMSPSFEQIAPYNQTDHYSITDVTP